MNNFWQRTFTGITFALIIIAGMWLHAYAYLAIFSVIVLLAMIEFVKMINVTIARVQAGWAVCIGMCWFLTSFFVLSGQISPSWLMLTVPLISAVFVTELLRKSTSPLVNIACTLVVPVYVAIPFSFLHFMTLKTGVFDHFPLLVFFLLIWSNDSGAYLVGSLVGKRKLFPSVSPNKSWEGAIGGLTFSLVAAFILAKVDTDFSLSFWLIAGLLVSVTGTFGDLVESMLKRSVRVKDSGRLLPGHGGMLDRFDAVIFAAPFVSGYFMLARFMGS